MGNADSTVTSDSSTASITVGEPTEGQPEPIHPSPVYASKIQVTVSRKSGKAESSFTVPVREDGSVTIDFPGELQPGDSIVLVVT